MWIKSDDGRLINLNRVDTIEINPVNSIICKINGKGISLSNCKTLEEAEKTLNLLREVLKAI